jgi:hypothetical protein
MRYLLIIAGTLGFSIAVAAEAPALTVSDVITHIDALNGKTVRVKGYLGECTGYDCNLFPDRAGRDAWDQWFARLRKGDRSKVFDQPMALGLGEENDFDRKAAPLQNSYVIITGKVTNECRYQGQRACTDRSTDLKPIDIVPAKDQ